MPTDRPKATAEPGFRRRLPLELTPAEFAKLEAAQPRYASKRATLVAGLDALTQLEQASAAGERAAAERDAALAQAGEATRRAEKAERRSSAGAAKAKSDSKTATGQAARLQRDLAKARADLAEARRLLQAEQRQSADWQHAYQDIQPRAIDALRCPRCKQWADPDQWGLVDADDGGHIVYHHACGYHEDGLVGATTILGYQDAR